MQEHTHLWAVNWKISSLCKLRLIVDTTYPYIICHESVSWRSRGFPLKKGMTFLGGLGFRVGAFWTDLPILIINGFKDFVLQKYENLSKLDTSSPLSLFIVAIMAFSWMFVTLAVSDK